MTESTTSAGQLKFKAPASDEWRPCRLTVKTKTSKKRRKLRVTPSRKHYTSAILD